MELRKLGNSDLQITPVGFGAWAIGGSGWEFAWGQQEDADSVPAILRALGLWVDWVETGAVDGARHSEGIAAPVLRAWKDQAPNLSTKCVLRWDEQRKVYPDHSAASIREECENSLRRLVTEAIDLYQMHWPPRDNGPGLEEAWQAMNQLKQEGKVRWVGVSNFDVGQMKRAAKIAPVTSDQPPYSVIRRAIEAEILPHC